MLTVMMIGTTMFVIDIHNAAPAGPVPICRNLHTTTDPQTIKRVMTIVIDCCVKRIFAVT